MLTDQNNQSADPAVRQSTMRSCAVTPASAYLFQWGYTAVTVDRIVQRSTECRICTSAFLALQLTTDVVFLGL